MKIISWNVNGIKSVVRKGFLEDIISQNPDIVCLQEIKGKEIPEIENYTAYVYPSSIEKNLHGTAIYTKIKPLSVKKGIDDEEFDNEGRVMKMEFENFNLYNVYAPSGGKSKERLQRKYRFYDVFTEYFNKSDKSSVICGDFNRASKEIDVSNPNMRYQSGFLPAEREWFRETLTQYVDAFRKFNKEAENYTWWSNKKGFREENKGNRLDYFLVSNDFENTITNSYILKDQLGSDHAPIALELNSCKVCDTVNNTDNEFCYKCGIKLIENEEKEEIPESRSKIPKDKIILLDLNYTLIANSKEIKDFPLEKKIKSQEYALDLIKLIEDNYVILITASPYKRSYKILRDIKEKTGFAPDESYWNFGGQPHQIKKYWMENEIIPLHGDDCNQYLAIESNPKTRKMYGELGIEAKPKEDFI